MKQKQVDSLNRDLQMLANNRPFEILTEEEKTDIIKKWALLRAEENSRKSTLDRIASLFISGFLITISFFGIAWALKMLFTILGII